jgi:cell division transport system permease protein
MAGFAALSGLTIIYFWLTSNLPELVRNVSTEKLFILSAIIMFAGIFIYVFSTFIVVNRYLKMRVDDLY